MKPTRENLTLKEALASLPYYSPGPKFNAKVMKALGFEIQPAFNCTLALEKTVTIIAACWLAGACFLLIRLLFAHAADILFLCLKPQALLSMLKFYALKSWLAGSRIISVLSKAVGIISFFAGKVNILPHLAVSSILAAIAITIVSRPSTRIRADNQ
ncbi:MAG TPA: hypothetical protein DCL44_01985 [Elusimicrobia bacterium]|nr:hypothetical protein [Elusimicrobiota bacterium]